MSSREEATRATSGLSDGGSRSVSRIWSFGDILSQEGDRWIIPWGYLGDRAPTDDNGFVDVARNMQKPEIFDLIRVAVPTLPLMPTNSVQTCASHYEELSCFRSGFPVSDDALCSFNPVQGITVAYGVAGFARMPGGRYSEYRQILAASQLIDIPLQIVDRQRSSTPACRKAAGSGSFINW